MLFLNAQPNMQSFDARKLVDIEKRWQQQILQEERTAEDSKAQLLSYQLTLTFPR